MTFDPDAFLAQDSGAFDPDAFLADNNESASIESPPQENVAGDLGAASDDQSLPPQNITQFRSEDDIYNDIRSASRRLSSGGRDSAEQNLSDLIGFQKELKSRSEFRGSTRAATDLPEIGSQLSISQLLPDADLKTQGLVSAALVSMSDPQEISAMLKNASPDIGISQDEAGNLIAANNKTGIQTIINRPGASALDVMQTAGRMAAFTPAGRLSGALPTVAGGIATETALQGLESAAGGEFNPEAVATEGLTSAAGLGIGKVLQGAKTATPADIKKGIVRESLLKRLEAGDPSKELLGKKAFNGEIIDAPFSAAVNRAKRQGIDERVLRSLETANPATKAKNLKAISILEKRADDAEFAQTARSSDPLGASVFARYEKMNGLRKSIGKEISNVVKKDLKGVALDARDINDEFFDSLTDLGVKFRSIDGKITPVFGQIDDISKSGTSNVVKQILPRLREKMSAEQAHKLKKLIDSAVNFDGLPTQDEALPKALVSSLKSMRASLNKTIGDSVPKYKAANERFAQVQEPLSQMDKMFKSMLGLSESQAIESGIGTKASRTLMSNNMTRGAMIDLLQQSEAALKSNKIKFDDDLIKQAVFIDELERMFGSEASASFTGGAARAVEQKGIEAAGGAIGIPLDLLRTGIDAAKGVNQKNAIKALKDMLKN